MPALDSPRFAGLAGELTGQDDERPALVLLHGLTYDRRLWGPALHELRHLDPSRRVLTLDLPGHGDSPRRDSYRMDDLVGVLDLALREAGLPAPVLVGHSISAVLATRYAARYRTGGVINVDQPLAVVPFAELLQSRQEVLRGPGYLALWEVMLAGMHLELLPEPARLLAEAISDPRQDLLLGYWDDLLTGNPAALGDRMTADLAEVRATGVPYQAVFGRDPRPEYEKWLAAMLPDAVVTVLPDSGHFPQLAHPVAFAELLANGPGSSRS